MNLKYGPIFADQSKCTENFKKLRNDSTETWNEHEKNQSQTNRIFENKNNVNKTEHNETTTSGQSDISTLETSRKSATINRENMDRENFYHWGATREIMEVIRRRNNSPETRRLVEQRNALSRPCTLRRRYDHQSQRTIFASSQPNKQARRRLPANKRRARRKSGRRRNWPRTGKYERRQHYIAWRQSTNCHLKKIQYRRERGQIHSDKTYRGKSDNKQESDRRKHEKGGIWIHAGFKNTNLKDRSRSGTNPWQKQHATRRPKNRNRRTRCKEIWEGDRGGNAIRFIRLVTSTAKQLRLHTYIHSWHILIGMKLHNWKCYILQSFSPFLDTLALEYKSKKCKIVAKK